MTTYSLLFWNDAVLKIAIFVDPPFKMTKTKHFCKIFEFLWKISEPTVKFKNAFKKHQMIYENCQKNTS